jgi:hypothetical protein
MDGYSDSEIKKEVEENRGKKFERERTLICKQCEHLVQIFNVCNVCGCFMPIKTKLKRAECPIGKWGKYEGE